MHCDDGPGHFAREWAHGGAKALFILKKMRYLLEVEPPECVSRSFIGPSGERPPRAR
jgi:hypothetical protein